MQCNRIRLLAVVMDDVAVNTALFKFLKFYPLGFFFRKRCLSIFFLIHLIPNSDISAFASFNLRNSKLYLRFRVRCVVSLELSDGHFLLVHGRFLVWEVDFWTAQERSGLALFWFGGLHTLLGQKVAGQDFHSSPWVAILLKLQHGLALKI